MVAFYGTFLGPGDLAFDVGSRVRAWRRFGARVAALEPQPDCVAVLRLLAVGAAEGTARLGLSSATPTVSSMSPEWIGAVSAGRVRWDRSVEVLVTTLDALVAAHGEPAFCKIDIERFEVDVPRGLSFEYPPRTTPRSPIETLRLASGTWLDAGGLRALLDRYRPRSMRRLLNPQRPGAEDVLDGTCSGVRSRFRRVGLPSDWFRRESHSSRGAAAAGLACAPCWRRRCTGNTAATSPCTRTAPRRAPAPPTSSWGD